MDLFRVAPESIVGWGFGLALYSFVYSIVMWWRDKPFGKELWQKFPPLSGLASMVFALTTASVWLLPLTNIHVRFLYVVAAGMAMVCACAPAWAYQRDNKQFSVKVLPYVGGLLAANIGISLFLRTFALYMQYGWQKEVLDFLFLSNLVAVYVFAALWLVLRVSIWFKWATPHKPAKKPRD